MISLEGKTALVTGAGGGIGFGIAEVLARLGARVGINDVREEAAAAAAARIGGNAFAVVGDVSDEDQAEAMIRTAVTTSGRIDILVNNAGIGETIAPITAQRIDEWQRVIDVNLRGSYLMCRAAARAMIPARSGSIINIASVAGLTPFPSSHAYGVSKAGIVMLTSTLAVELARYGIRVNAVAPGVIDAPMLGVMKGDGERLPRILARVPLGRLGRTEDIGNGVGFLASDVAAYITGVVLPIDGGWTAYGGVGPASYPSHSAGDR